MEVMTTGTVRDNKPRQRFELDVGSALAFANYRLAQDTVIITHTETPPALRGRGIASELVKGALELIRADGQKVVAGCGFVVDYLNKHPEYADLVAYPYRPSERKKAREPRAFRSGLGRKSQCLISGGSLPPLAASLAMTC